MQTRFSVAVIADNTPEAIGSPFILASIERRRGGRDRELSRRRN
jgi:hypothetical protein